MLPLYEMMMRAQNGEAMRAMASQFGLNEDQVTQAMEALMPAFATGFKRSAANPQDFGSLMQAMAGANYAEYFNNLASAFTPQGIADGNTMLKQIFGSKQISEAIAQQAALATGIAQDIFNRMLPVVASILAGGFFSQGGAATAGANPFADMMGQMMSQAAASQKQAADFTEQLGKMMENTFGSGGKSSQSANPFADMMDTMMKAGFPGMTGSDKTEPEKAEEPDNPYSKFIGDMFDAGIKVQKDYQKNLDSVFDSYMNGMKKKD
ncbi:DUF937 domain-containing protein [Hoeflea poritis]|uniref:DUF937 domain-containing protein n=1 Tax=Hoeflea poritis TaxID=2993659 RepID=A0ABT4VSB0_9HYPH|nr:DUF937 domain-containing protein [Hoeflea poritis]MDA4847596.1 DUF937 domain-containing protein [Hoeflea poritis]